MITFSADTHQNEYLAAGASEINAIITVSSVAGDVRPEPIAGDVRPEAIAGDVRPEALTDAAEILIVDTSASMNYPATKLVAAQRATATGIDCIRDGVAFAVIAGSWEARQLYPAAGTLATASTATRREAKEAIDELEADGGTAIGAWLALANDLFATRKASINHAVLLTDGKDDGETPEELEEILAMCQGKFQCDCRGVGTDWAVSELRKVASALLGTLDIVADPAQLTADFAAMVEQAMEKATADVALRIWTPQTAKVSFVKQVAPTVEDLTGRRVALNDRVGEYPIGAWGAESRDYHLCVAVQPAAIGVEMLAARLSVVVGDEVVSQALVRALWTDDAERSTRIDGAVAHYSGQAELAQVIHEGLQARKAGDEATATTKLGRAAQLAAASGNEATTRLLSKVVDVDDAATGTVRLKSRVDDADEMTLDTRSTKTVRIPSP